MQPHATTISPTHATVPSLQSAIDQKGDTLFSILLASSQPRLGTYIALAKAIQAAGHRAVVVHPAYTFPSSDELVGFESVEFSCIPFEALRCLHGVDLFFSPELVSDVAPPGAVTIGVLHSLPDAGLTQTKLTANAAQFIRVNPPLIRTFDYLVAAVRQQGSEWTVGNYEFMQGVYPAAFFKGRRTRLDIVPAGYPKLDYARQILAPSSTDRCIIYSPTAGRSSVSRVRQDGEAVLSALLRAFPDTTIVFRPYPEASEIKYARALAERFASNPNLVLDETPLAITYQKACHVAITDSSSSALTFALATGRPLVFVSLASPTGTSPNTATATPTTNPFGYRASSIPAMLQAVREGIAHSSRWHQQIMEHADRCLYNPGAAAEYLASSLPRFARRDTHPDWLSIDRRPWRPSGAPGEVQRHLGHLHAWSERRGKLASRMYNEIASYLDRDVTLARRGEPGSDPRAS